MFNKILSSTAYCVKKALGLTPKQIFYKMIDDVVRGKPQPQFWGQLEENGDKVPLTSANKDANWFYGPVVEYKGHKFLLKNAIELAKNGRCEIQIQETGTLIAKRTKVLRSEREGTIPAMC